MGEQYYMQQFVWTLDNKGANDLHENELKLEAKDEDAMARLLWTVEHGHEVVARLLVEQDSN